MVMCNQPSEFENQIWEHLVARLICFAHPPSVIDSRRPVWVALLGSADLGQLETVLLEGLEGGVCRTEVPGPYSHLTL